MCTHSDAINSYEEYSLRLDLREEVLDVGKYGGEHLLFGQSEMDVAVIWVRAWRQRNECIYQL